MIEGRRTPLATRKPQLSAAAVVAIVLLRLIVGWHFFTEGVAKYVQPEAFSSAAFFEQAKGPLAPFFHGLVPDFHHQQQFLDQPLAIRPLSEDGESRQESEAIESEFPPHAPYSKWADEIVRDWQSTVQRLIESSTLDDEQQAAAADVLDKRKQQLGDYLAEMSDEIATYRHELYRLEGLERDRSTGELPYHDTRIALKQAEAGAMPRAWVRSVQAFERGFTAELLALVDDDQKPKAAAALEKSGTSQIDTVATYLILSVGVCLILGLFTRPAALAGALFLLVVIATQPPWISGAAPVYDQSLEMIALVVLATTGAGRLAGLDFFVHRLLRGCCGRKRETT